MEGWIVYGMKLCCEMNGNKIHFFDSFLFHFYNLLLIKARCALLDMVLF